MSDQRVVLITGASSGVGQSTARIAANRITESDPWRQRALDAIRDDEEKAPGSEVVAEMLNENVLG
jgi:NAD(P)-dependent dehydrogenase (short-subunit alcohol dehydrogenase family)